MKEALQNIRQSADALIAQAADAAAVDELRVRFLGKKGELTAILKQMGRLSAEERPVVGALANEVREAITADIARRTKELESAALAARLAAEEIDVTLPGKAPAQGKRHPFEQVLGELKEIFLGMGFDIVSGPEEKVSDSEDAKWRQAAAEIEAKKQAAASGTAGTSAGEFNRIQAEYARSHPTADMYGPPRPAGLSAQPKALAPQPASAKEPASLPALQSAPAAAPAPKAASAQAPVVNNTATFQFTINGMPAADFANGVMNVVKAHQNDLQNMISNIVNDQVRKMYAAAGS